ncbi:substrate-binding domain-containing protein, partial [Glaesserella parasuis]|uniref:substrate-binding domain-containing protein n=1 Tax=Glaesserella parasuis TaxID=738 RepID=UPI003B67DBF1
LMGILGLDATAKRSEGVKEVFARTGNVKVVSEQEGKWERDRALTIAENVLVANKKINVIASNNDEMAIGAVLASRKLGIKDEDV